MGELDKGLIKLAAKPLVTHVIDRLRPQVAEVIVSANRNQEAYSTFGCPVIPDDLSDQPGPLAGILAAAKHTAADWLLIAPCDTPFLPADLAARLLDTANTHKVQLVRAADGERTHYVIMLLHRDLLIDMAGALAGGEHRVQAWQARHTHAEGVFAEPGAFFNVNTEDDLRRAAVMAK
jgi:molybdopterin-guanine dinucleotide biosynthesis protein A